jgi:hypothetical protein
VCSTTTRSLRCTFRSATLYCFPSSSHLLRSYVGPVTAVFLERQLPEFKLKETEDKTVDILRKVGWLRVTDGAILHLHFLATVVPFTDWCLRDITDDTCWGCCTKRERMPLNAL